MSITTWCIIGMIACAIIGYLRIKNRQGAFKSVMIVVYTVAFLFFLVGAVTTHNSDKATDRSTSSNIKQAEDTQLVTYFKALEKEAKINFTFNEKSQRFLNEHPEYFKNDSSNLVHDDMNFIVDYNDMMNNIDNYADKIVFLPAAKVVSFENSDNSKAAMVELNDDEGNYYLLISDQNLSGISEGIYVGGYYTPVGTVEFEGNSDKNVAGIIGAVALLEAN